MYPVNEVFASIQGEGSYTGIASIFIRMQGCDVGCPWCDTKHTWKTDIEQRIDVDEIARRAFLPIVSESPGFAQYGPNELLGLVYQIARGRALRHVVITGGEPALYDLSPLITVLRGGGFQVQVETSGTEHVPMRTDYWLTLSPKIKMPGGKIVLPTSWLRCNEIKLPVGKQKDIDLFVEESEQWQKLISTRPIFLQPLSQSSKATELCVEQAMERGWRVSLQTHKFVGLR